MGNYSKQNYQKKVEEIFTRYPSVQKVPFGDAYKPGLENMFRFEEVLGNPHKLIRTIHIAGTNGKGSVANMLASALASSGLKVGLYTSPHILDFRERMRVLSPGAACPGATLIPEEYVFDFLIGHGEEMDALDLSFFEITTGLAFRWFADEKVDVAVVEVGLGGRLDSTNVITPDLAVVTSIALDHTALLGGTLEAIAGEKAGIFKKDVPALVGEDLPATRPVFEAIAEQAGCPLTFAQDAEPSLWRLSDRILSRMDLRGKYQSSNLRTVLAAIDILMEMPQYSGLKDSLSVVEAIEDTASRMDFHGRWELLSREPRMIADIGHNPAALKKNFGQLQEMLDTGECTSLIIVYAIMADKDLDGIMPLFPAEATCIFTNPDTHRALPEKELTARYKAYCGSIGRPVDRIFDAPSVREALSMAKGLARQSSVRRDASRFPSPLIFVGGSTYLVSEVVKLLDSLQRS